MKHNKGDKMKSFIKITKNINRPLRLSVLELKSGKWLAQIYDHAPGTEEEMHLCEKFNTVEQALSAIGYPYDLIGIPKELI